MEAFEAAFYREPAASSVASALCSVASGFSRKAVAAVNLWITSRSLPPEGGSHAAVVRSYFFNNAGQFSTTVMAGRSPYRSACS
jgi:hypothetical protein